MRKYVTVLLWALFHTGVSDSTLYAKKSATAITPESTSVDFIENQGQWAHPGKYVAQLDGGVLFLTDSGFVYDFSHQDDLSRPHCAQHYNYNNNLHNNTDDFSIRHHAYRVYFTGANTYPSYETADKRTRYHNYFLGRDSSRWRGGVGLYGKVVQKDIYDGIDLAVYGQAQGLKYDFIVAAGSSPEKIQMQFEGVTPVLNHDGALEITTTVNKIIEKAPYAYQIIDGVLREVPSHYRLHKGTVSFEFPEGYDARYTLIIDPILDFATYSTGRGGDYFGYSTTYDKEGNLYAGANALTGAQQWPTTTGAFQVKHGGFDDVAINKYNASGTAILYSTYYGGSLREAPNAMIVNDRNELIVVGSTISEDLPVTNGCYQDSLNISYDLFIVHFNTTGTALIGATYIGGTANENNMVDLNGVIREGMGSNDMTSPVEVNYDEKGNIWVLSNTYSKDFPVTANALQKKLNGNIDAILCQLSPDCSQLLYSTYLGGSKMDVGFGLQVNHDGNIVICGTTSSPDFPVTAGALHINAPGSIDGFVSIFNPTTGTLLASTYLGTDNVDNAVAVQVGSDNNIYVLGRTLGNYPISSGVYNMERTDMFIHQISADLNRSLLSTRLGVEQSSLVGDRYFPCSFLVDNCENVYVTGRVKKVPGMPLTSDAFLTDPADFWYVVLKPAFSDLLFASYFGYGHFHTSTQRLDPDGIVYQSFCAGNEMQSPAPTPGVVGPQKLNSGHQDMYSFKFSFQLSGVRSSIGLADNQSAEGCAPYTVQFQNNSRSPHSMDFNWDFGDGSPVSTATNPTHTFSQPDTYTVVLHAHSDSACKTDDSDTLIIIVQTVEPPVIQTADTLVCSGTNEMPLWVTVTNPNETTYQWEPATGILSDARKPVITVNPSLNTTYTVTVTNHSGICNLSVTDTVEIHFYPRSLTLHTPDTAVCEGAVIAVRAESTPGYTYHWSPATGINDTSILEPLITVTQSLTYQLTASYPGCPDTALLLDIDMQEVPRLKITPSQAVCAGSPVALTSDVSPYRKDYRYTWTPGEKLSYPGSPNTSFTADSSVTYYLEVATPIGCRARDSVRITVYPGDFASVIADTGYCPGGAVMLWAEGGTNYSWTPSYGLNDSSIAQPIASPAAATRYEVYVTNAHGCVDTQEVRVMVYPEAVINIPDSITLYPGEQYQLTLAGNAHYYQWFPPSGISNTDIANPVFYPEVRTRYYVTATTEYGCVVKDSIDILVTGTILDLPNAFHPGTSTFKPSKRGIASLNRFEVYNRWGNRVFYTENIDEGWDGTYKGVAQPMGVYLYVFEAVLDNGRIVSRQGNVTLIR